MAVIGGAIFVLVAVLVGFSMAGGHVGALIHPSEFVTIGGASFGALIIMSPKKVMFDLLNGCLQLIKGSPYSKQTYADLFKLLYAISKLARRDGLIALDTHVNSPHESPLFKKYPSIGKNHHITDFICGGLSLLLDGKAEASALTSQMEDDIKVIEREHHAAVAALSKTADALPGFGIVAAVLGIVVTMQAIDGPAEEIGHKVGAALVGTFLGILMSYGFFAPMAGRMELMGEQESTFFRTISSAVVGISQGLGPRDVIMNARRMVGTDCRPSMADLKVIFKEGEAI
jgi:chemotaxis protein MotA